MTTLPATGVSTEVLLGTANALLYGLALWMGHEWWKDHKAQHKQLDESITRCRKSKGTAPARGRA